MRPTPIHFLTGALLLAAGEAVAVPNGTYYLTDLGNSSLWGIRGSGYAQTPMDSGAGESPIAIVALPDGQEVRTTGYIPGLAGSGYRGVDAPELVPTGASYPNGLTGTYIYDGTGDGTHNYASAVVAGNVDRVYRFDSAWSNPEFLFSLPSTAAVTGSWYGITYDRTNATLWFLNHATGGLVNYDLNGAELASYSVASGLAALAMDIDHTLWMNETATGTLFHYDAQGHFLETLDLAEKPATAYGGEIGYAPEIDAGASTSALTVLAVTLTLAGERRRRA